MEYKKYDGFFISSHDNYNINPNDSIFLYLSLHSRSDFVGFLKVKKRTVKSKLLKKNGITIHLPTTNIYNKFSDKLSFILECQQFKILVPEEIVFPSKFLNPFVIKPKTLKNESDVLDAHMLIENIESYNKLVVLNINIKKQIVKEFI